MADCSFEIRDHNDYFAKLEAEFEDLRREPLSSRHAMNFAMNAYHMCEWVWEYEPLVKARYSGSKVFYDTVNGKCPAIPVMRDLTNGSKHTKITKGPPPVVKSTGVRQGFCQATFVQSSFGQVGALVVNMANGTSHKFLDLAVSARDFWAAAFHGGFQI